MVSRDDRGPPCAPFPVATGGFSARFKICTPGRGEHNRNLPATGVVMLPEVIILSCILTAGARTETAGFSKLRSPSPPRIAEAGDGARALDISGTDQQVAPRSREVGPDEPPCNAGAFEGGLPHDVVFCQGEDWALPSGVERSAEGRLIVSMSPLERTGNEEDPYTEVYNSPDWHGYTINGGWGFFEAYKHQNYLALFEREPYLSEYLFRDYYDEDEDGEVWYNAVHSLYKLSDIPCVNQCIERLGEGNEDLCQTKDSDDMIWDDVMPWFLLWGSDDLGACLDEAFIPSTAYDIINTSAGHNGNGSPRWLSEVGVRTIFEAFEDWCVSNPDRCDTTYVKNAYTRICDSSDCGESDSYRDVYDNFDAVPYDGEHDLYVDEAGAIEDTWINSFLQQRREYSHLSYEGNKSANVYAFFDSDYIDHQCRFFQKVLATIDKFGAQYPAPFTMYLNSESGNMPTLPNTILSVEEIDEWAQNMIDVGLSLSQGLSDSTFSSCGLEPYEITTLQSYLGEDPTGIWSVNINNGGRVFRKWARQAIANGMGVATHGESGVLTHHFLQHFYPYIQYDQENLTYRTCLNDLNCEEFIPDLADSVRLVDYPPFESEAWGNVQNGSRPFSHIHIDMTHLHKDINTLGQYRKFRMSALGALALGVNQIKLSSDQLPSQGVHQEFKACPNAEEDYEYSCENLRNHEDDAGNELENSSSYCNVNWSCIEDYDPYAFVQWVGKNIGTNMETAPEAYCALFSSGQAFEGDFEARMREIWDTSDWEMERDGVWRQNYNGDQAPAIRSPYIASMGRFCTLDMQASNFEAARDLEAHYGLATPQWSAFPSYDPNEAITPSETGVLEFRLSQSFIEESRGSGADFAIKVVFAVGEGSDPGEKGVWALNYYDGSQWASDHSVTYDPTILGDDLYTATFHLDHGDLHAAGNRGGNHLQIQPISGARPDFLLLRVIPVSNAS